MTTRQRGQVGDHELDGRRRDQADQLLRRPEPGSRLRDEAGQVVVRQDLRAGGQGRLSAVLREVRREPDAHAGPGGAIVRTCRQRGRHPINIRLAKPMLGIAHPADPAAG